MKVRVQFFSRLKDVTGCARQELELPADAIIDTLLAQLFENHPKLVDWNAHMLIAVGLEYVPRDHALREGDVVSIMPPVQGG